MTTALGAQLARIAANSTNALDLKAQKKAHSQSLIFDQRVAASQDFDTIYQICIEGYQEMCQIDARFAGFARSIFSEQSKSEERTQMTAAQNLELDEVLESFLGLVGARILLKPALKAVEWLVRRFRIQEHNTVPLILTFLPYHTLPIFPTVLSIIPRNLPPSLKFLHPYIESLASPPRHTIVYTAIHNQSFFTALNSYVLKTSRAGHHYQALLSCWASLITEAVAGMLDQTASGRQEVQKQKKGDILLRILPFLNEGLSMKKVPDLRVGCYMILTVLVSKAHLEDNILDAMMEAVVSHWTSGTTHAGLICLTVMSRNRQMIQLPRKVYNAVISIKDIEDDLITLRTRYQVDRLVLGLVLGVLEGLCKNNDAYRLKFVRLAIESSLMDDRHISEAVKSILSTASKVEVMANQGLDVQGQLTDLILRLSESEAVGRVVRDTIKNAKINMDDLEMKLQAVIRPEPDPSTPNNEDVEMEDVVQKTDEAFENIAKRIPTRTAYEMSFLSHSESYVFGSLCNAFLLAASSTVYLKAFSDFAVLRKSLAMSEPLFLSFFIRIWCGPYPVIARSAALNCVSTYLKETSLAADVQLLLPYVINALGDSAAKVRRAAIDLVLTLSPHYVKAGSEDKEQKNLPTLGKDNLYGPSQGTHGALWISLTDVVKFIEDILVPNLEECRLDASHISRRLIESFNASKHSKNPKFSQRELKTSVRNTIFAFLSIHVIETPLYSVKVRLLSILNQVEKVGSISRTKLLLPLLKAQANQSEKLLKEICAKEELTESDVVLQLVGIVSPTDKDGILFLQKMILPAEISSSRSLRMAAFQHIRGIWASIKSDMQMTLSETLMKLAAGDSQNSFTEDVEDQALETLRSVPLSTPILLSMLGKLPSLSKKSSDGPSATKRRRMSQGHMDASGSFNSENTSKSMKSITIVLELVESSKAAKAPQLLKVLFQVLADTQHCKTQTGTELGYVQSLVLGSLHAIIEKEKNSPKPQIDNSAVRADLIVDCARSTSTPQVQQAALLLLSDLASVIPEVVIHSVMPVFTFMGSSVLRQNDDYSAHVVDKTINSIIPPLVDNLRKDKHGPVVGASELLLSFVAAFEHIPIYRRQSLFRSLVDKLGPEDFLFAVLVMLMDKYTGDEKVTDFAMELVGLYSPKTQLKTVERYLDAIVDTLSPTPTLSEHLLSFSNLKTPEVVALNLLSLPPPILHSHRLVSRTAKVFVRQDSGDDAIAIRKSYSQMVEHILLLTAKVKHQKRLHGACERVMDALLGLLSMQEFIKSLEILLEQNDIDIQRQGLISLERRINSSKSGDLATQNACLSFLTQLKSLLRDSPDVLLKHTATICVDRIIEKYGKRDTDAVVSAIKVISGNDCLIASDSRLRVISLLCMATSVEVLREGIIPVIPQALPKAIDHLKSSIDDDPEDESLHNAVYSFLEALFTHVPWIITEQYLDRFLCISHESANAGLSSRCHQYRIDVLKLLAKQVEPRECFAALERTWGSAMTEGPQAVEEHLEILSLAIDRQPKLVVTKQSHALSDLLLKVFDLRRIQLSPRTDESYTDEEIDRVEIAANQVAIKIIYKLNDTTFRPMFAKMLDWATWYSSKNKNSRSYRQTTWYRFLHTFFSTLKSIVTSYASFIIDNSVEILNSFSPNNPNSIILSNHVLLTLTACFEHDQDEFWQSPSHFNPISNPLLTLLPHTPLLNSLLPAIIALAASTSSPDHHKSINTGVLAHLRASSDNSQTRLAAVRCQVELTKKLGEEWLALLPEMLPFIAEALEDGDEEVEAEVRGWVRGIEEILGESLDAMLV